MIYNFNDVEDEKYISLVRNIISKEKKSFHIITFGCQQNEADSERIMGLCEAMGFYVTDKPENSDLIIMNTCAIREHAEVKALSLLGRFKALKKTRPELIVGVVGCMAAESHRAEMIKQDFHFVTFTLEPNMLHLIPKLIFEKLNHGKRSFICGADKGDIYEGIQPVRRSSHKEWVSIMYGCNNFCSYCIVPYVRGRERSRNSADVINECKELINSGIKDITLLGQNVNSYKSDMDFPGLLSKIAEIEGDFLIRFMTSHPKDVSSELIYVMKRHKGKIAPFFHLPLQSGSNRILSLMNRTYTKEKYLNIVRELRNAIPDIALSTDIIVGFPGETYEDFKETLGVLSYVKFDNVYAFHYSKREGTRAAKLTDEVGYDEKHRRMNELLQMQDGISLEKNTIYEGQLCRVLIDSLEHKDGNIIYTGRTDTNKLVHFVGKDLNIGEFVTVKIEKACHYDLRGQAV